MVTNVKDSLFRPFRGSIIIEILALILDLLIIISLVIGDAYVHIHM